MEDDLALAFGPPEARAKATAPALRDRLLLHDYIAKADVGAFQKERGRPQRLRFQIVVELAPPAEAPEDDVDKIVSYDRLIAAVEEELQAQRHNLLETLAEGIAARILTAPRTERVFLRIEKLDLGPFALGVEIVRSAGAAPPPGAAPAGPRPEVVFLSNDVIAAPDLSARLDRILTPARPVILTVGLPKGALPRTGHGPTERRIALLAMEQNAWVLAARDPRCVVVASRTEIDWAIGRGQTLVWAPSKLVLDSPRAPRKGGGQALALWLAEELGAAALTIFGPREALPDSATPVQEGAA